MSKQTYEVLTWDINKETFTPQQGVRKGPYSKWGLRRALRKLRAMGYDTTKAGGVSVFIAARDSEHEQSARRKSSAFFKSFGRQRRRRMGRGQVAD